MSTFPQLDLPDLQEAGLPKLNRLLGLLSNKISLIFGSDQTTPIGASLVAPSFQAAQQNTPPTNPNELITLQSATALFGTQTQRVALQTGTNTTSGETVQPIIISGGGNNISFIQYGTYADRPLPGNTQTGTLYVITDRSEIVYQNQVVAGVNKWIYVGGVLNTTQSALAGLGLGTTDIGLLVNVSDYNHMLQWLGSAFDWGPGDNGSGYIQAFLVDPSPTVGWKLCDGSSGITYLKSDGTLSATFTVPNLVGTPAYLKFGTPASSTINTPVAPTLSMNSYTPAGTIGGFTFSGTPTTPTGTVGSTFAGGGGTTSNDSGTGTTVQSGAGVTVASHTHTHTFTPSGTVTSTFAGDPLTPAGTISGGTFSGTPATLTGTISSTGQPSNIVLRPWLRL